MSKWIELPAKRKWIEFTLAKLLGKKCVGIDISAKDGMTTKMTCYYWKGVCYITGYEQVETE